MPNPFPGMNPYLENRRLWSSVHTTLIYGINSALNHSLPEGFAAHLEQRLYIAGGNKYFQPDVFAVARRPAHMDTNGNGSVAVLSPPLPATTTAVRIDLETSVVRERFIEIRTTDESETLIAVIEVLSPSNKSDERGRFEYKRKRETIFASTAHLMEIDLLRDGPWTVAPSENEIRLAFAPFDYIISLHHGATVALFDIWAVPLRERLPVLHVPLTEEAGWVMFDLQEILNRAYDDAGYDRLLDYHVEPETPLSTEDTEWADTILRSTHRR